MSEGYNLERKKRTFEQRMAGVVERHPELSERIVRSLRTPKKGRYHNEGPTMESHLRTMSLAYESALEGIFPEGIGEIIKSTIGETLRNLDEDEIDAYIFLPDISKPDRLLIKTAEGEQEVALEDWEAMNAAEREKVEEISYFHPSNEATGHHGPAAAEGPLAKEILAPRTVKAIREHMIAHLSFPN